MLGGREYKHKVEPLVMHRDSLSEGDLLICLIRTVVPKRLLLLTLAILAATATIQSANEDLRLPDPTYPAAVALWKDGRVPDALIALNREVTDQITNQPLEALVLRAVLLGEAGRAEEAEALWHAVIDREIWMRTFSRRALVDSLTRRGAPEAAGAILAELTRSDATRHIDMMLRTADAYRRKGDHKQAANHYRRVLSRQRRGTSADRARLGLAQALETAGNRTAALAMLRDAQLEHWTADTFTTARAEEHRLGQAASRVPRPFGEGQYRTLVRRLRNASRYQAALGLIDDWRDAYSSPVRADRIEAERISTLYAQRANKEAVAACAHFYEQFGSSGLLANIRQIDFRLAVRMADTDRARRLGLDLWADRVGDTPNRNRRNAAELLASYLVAVGDVDGGLDLYHELFRTARSADNQRAILWRAGVAALRAGQNTRALTNLRGLNNRHPSGDLRPAGLYWLAVAEARAGETGAATRSFRAVAEGFPYHYYGLRARERLVKLTNGVEDAQPNSDFVLRFPMLSVSTATRARPEFKAAMVLARAGLTEDGAWYVRRLLNRRRHDRGLALLAARASAKAGNYTSVSRILANHFGAFLQRPARGLPADFWTLVYPRPFWETTYRSARSHGVDPVLLLALMRQESRFDPAARSPVGAIGLYQIMPYTAEALADSAGVGEIIGADGVDETALTNPAVNSAIAARLNANLLEMFDSAIAPVIASYNAGEKRAAIWWAAARHLPEDFFIDTIPYSETRRFVREVLANYMAYQRTYEDP